MFSLFLDLSHPVLARNNVGSMFFNFMIFFAIFFGIFLLGSSMNRMWTKFFFFFFFLIFLGLLYPVLDRNNAGKRFFNFFGIFFRNFLARVEYERNSGLRFFFFSFLAYLISFWLKIMPERGFFIF